MSVVEATVTNHAPADLNEAGLAIDCKVKKILYGSFLAVRVPNPEGQNHRLHWAVGLWQELGTAQPQPHE